VKAIVRKHNKRQPPSIVHVELPKGHDWELEDGPFQEAARCKRCGLKIVWDEKVWVCSQFWKNRPGNPIPPCDEEAMYGALE